MPQNKTLTRSVLAAALLLGAWALYTLVSHSPPDSPLLESPLPESRGASQHEPGTVQAEISEPPTAKRPGPDVALNTASAKPDSAVAPRTIPDTLTISGSVLNQQGERLSDIELIASPRALLGTKASEEYDLGTISDTNGHYAFANLDAGAYLIRSIETPLYPGTTINVRAGTDTADLVLGARQDLWVYGLVTDSAGTPLAGVQIQSGREPSNVTYTDSAGSYGIFLTVHGGTKSHDSLQFSLTGYHDKRMPLRPPDAFASDLALADVRLDSIDGLGGVRGTVTADDAPVPNARVFLRSTRSNNHYSTTTDAGGYFVLPDVATGVYTLDVVPRAVYQDYTQSDLEVSANGLELQIALQVVQSGRLHGQMVDVNGKSVPEFSLWLSSQSARARGTRSVQGNAQGQFVVDEVPVGEARLATHAAPRLRITGVSVTGRDDPPVQLVLDVGEHALTGHVIDSFSNPVPGAQVSLIWSHETGGLTSHAVRNTTTDTSGYFRYTQLGSGVHTLNVNAAGFQRRRIEHDVGISSDVQIELTAYVSTR